MAHFSTQLGPILGPKWSEDGPKLASWRVLGPFGGQVGPKMETRGFQGRKTQFVPPMLGPKLGPHFGHFSHQSGLQEASRGTWMTCCFQASFFERNVVSQDLPEPLKTGLSLQRGANFSIFSLWLVGQLLGAKLAPFRSPSWSQVGPCWAPSWFKMAIQHNTKNYSIKKSCGSSRPIPTNSLGRPKIVSKTYPNLCSRRSRWQHARL